MIKPNTRLFTNQSLTYGSRQSPLISSDPLDFSISAGYSWRQKNPFAVFLKKKLGSIHKHQYPLSKSSASNLSIFMSIGQAPPSLSLSSLQNLTYRFRLTADCWVISGGYIRSEVCFLSPPQRCESFPRQSTWLMDSQRRTLRNGHPRMNSITFVCQYSRPCH